MRLQAGVQVRRGEAHQEGDHLPRVLSEILAVPF